MNLCKRICNHALNVLHTATHRSPRNVSFETLSRCNRKCFYCPNAYIDRPAAYMDPALCERVMKSLARYGYVGSVSLTGYG